MTHDLPASQAPSSPVDISRRSDRENLFILILVAVALIYLLVRTAEMKEMRVPRSAPTGPIQTLR